MSKKIQRLEKVDIKHYGQRLDKVATGLFQDYSRAVIQSWIEKGFLLIDGKKQKAKYKLQGGECLSLSVELVDVNEWQAEPIPLDVVFEDDDIIILNKPIDLVVHPAAGNWQGTLVNGLLFYCPELAHLPRAGIVHRLDKDTCGLMVVAKNLQAHRHLVRQLQNKSVYREYEAICYGNFIASKVIDLPIGRHPRHRIKMSVVDGGKKAISRVNTIGRFQGYSHVRVKLETGRTHQIRVHMAHVGHPLVGDPLYASSYNPKSNISEKLKTQIKSFNRQALQAKKLGLVHPKSNQYLEWEVDLANDMKSLLKTLQTKPHS